MELFDFHWEQSLYNFIKLSVAIILAIPIGWERGQGSASVGFRTFPIVSVASCGFIMIAKILSKEDDTILASTIQGMLSGVGFIGGGVILKQKGDVYGIVTAASIWNTGAIGISIAVDELEIAVFLSIINFLSLYILTPVIKGGYLESKGGFFKPKKEKTGLLDENGDEIKIRPE